MQEISVAELVATVRKQAGLIAGLSILAAVVVGAWGYATVPRKWVADSTIMFESSANLSGLNRFMTEFGLSAAPTSRGNFETILRSRELRGRVVDQLGLEQELGAKSHLDAVRLLGEMTSIDQPAEGVIVVRATWTGEPRLSGGGRDPAAEKAAQLCNEIVATLGEIVSELDFASASQQRKFLEEQLARTEEELLAAEDALVEYATAEGLISPSSQTSASLQAVSQLRQREIDLRVELQAARDREAEALRRLGSQERMVISQVSEQRDPQIDQLDQRVMELQRQIAEQMEIEGKSEQHPDVARLKVELERAQEQLAELLRHELQPRTQTMSVDPQYEDLVKEALDSRLSRTGLEAKLRIVSSERESAMSQLRELPAKTARYEELQREVTVKREALARLTQQYEGARVAEAGSVAQFNVLDEAVPPERPSGTSLRKSVLLTFFAALLVSTLLAFWRQGRTDARAAAESVAPDDPETP